MAEVLSLLVGLLFQPALCWWIVSRDQRTLPAEQLARTWNEASLLSAVVLFGPVAVLVHFVKARGILRGLPWGFLWASLALGLCGGVSWVVTEAVDGLISLSHLSDAAPGEG